MSGHSHKEVTLVLLISNETSTREDSTSSEGNHSGSRSAAGCVPFTCKPVWTETLVKIEPLSLNLPLSTDCQVIQHFETPSII